MELLKVLSKTEQVTNFLRQEIGSEKLRPGDKIQSSRNLAAFFSTSKQVVESAFNVLEEEGLIIRRARRGAFVNKSSVFSNLTEVYILGLGVTENNPYFSEILKLTYPPILKDNFSFMTKTYPSGSNVENILDIEISRINNMPGLDCVLIVGILFDKDDVRKCLQVNKPVIFLGDFSKGDITDFEFNQVAGDNAYLAEQYIDHISEIGHNEATFFSGSLKHWFNKQFYEGLSKKAKEKDIGINLIELPKGISGMSDRKRNGIIEKLVKQALLDKKILSAAIISGVEQDPIKQGLKALDPSLYQKIYFPPDMHIDFLPFHNAIIHRVEELIKSPDKFEKVKAKLPVEFENRR